VETSPILMEQVERVSTVPNSLMKTLDYFTLKRDFSQWQTLVKTQMVL